MEGRGRSWVACRIIHSVSPSLSPFSLDFGFGIWDLDLGPEFGTWIWDSDLGLDLGLTILKSVMKSDLDTPLPNAKMLRFF